MRESKECEECGGIYFRAETASEAMWEARRYCGPSCAGKGASRRNRERKEEVAAVLESEPVVAVLPAPPETKQPVMRDLKIVRVGPNPRMLLCEYYELAERKVCTVDVKKNIKFVKGMRFSMPEPKSEEDYRRPWVYEGKPPRHKGKW